VRSPARAGIAIQVDAGAAKNNLVSKDFSTTVLSAFKTLLGGLLTCAKSA